MNRQSKQIERVCDKVENKISYTCDVKNKCDVLSEIKENETSYMIDNSRFISDGASSNFSDIFFRFYAVDELRYGI
jgi:hypothetical protein